MLAEAYIQMQNQTHKKSVPNKVLCMFKNAISLIFKHLPPPPNSLIIKQLCCIYIITCSLIAKWFIRKTGNRLIFNRMPNRIFRTGKQAVWFLGKTNLGKYSLCNLCSRCRGGDVADILLAGKRESAHILLVRG